MRISLIHRLLSAQKKIFKERILPINIFNTSFLYHTRSTTPCINRVSLDTTHHYISNIRKIHLCSYDRGKHGRTRDDVMDDDDPEMSRFLADLECDLPGNQNAVLTEDDDTASTRYHNEHETTINDNNKVCLKYMYIIYITI